MDKNRIDNLSDLRRQRERFRRIGTVALVAAGIFVLVSCEELTRRDAAPPPPGAASQITLQGASSAGGAAAERRL